MNYRTRKRPGFLSGLIFSLFLFNPSHKSGTPRKFRFTVSFSIVISSIASGTTILNYMRLWRTTPYSYIKNLLWVGPLFARHLSKKPVFLRTLAISNLLILAAVKFSYKPYNQGFPVWKCRYSNYDWLPYDWLPLLK